MKNQFKALVILTTNQVDLEIVKKCLRDNYAISFPDFGWRVAKNPSRDGIEIYRYKDDAVVAKIGGLLNPADIVVLVPEELNTIVNFGDRLAETLERDVKIVTA